MVEQQKKIPLKLRIARSKAGKKGGRARARKLSAKRRSEIARLGGLASPVARWPRQHARRSIAEQVFERPR